jgi:hypothetical protein
MTVDWSIPRFQELIYSPSITFLYDNRDGNPCASLVAQFLDKIPEKITQCE